MDTQSQGMGDRREELWESPHPEASMCKVQVSLWTRLPGGRLRLHLEDRMQHCSPMAQI